MHVLITGATGLIGKEIVSLCLEKGMRVNYLTTSRAKIIDNKNYKGFYWNPNTQEIDNACFEHVDAIIHLVGASVSKRWTTAHKKEMLSSRIQTTQLLLNSLKTEKHTIKQIVSASAIGIYPNSVINFYTEDFKIKTPSSFLAQVVNEWETAVDEFSKLNIVVSKIRIGLVLSKKGGVLQKITKPIKLGFGAAFGKGTHWQSWIHVTDLATIFLYVLKHNLSGVYNGVSPNPITNQDLTKAIATVLKKPLVLPNIPKFLMALILGEMHVLLFDSQRVSSKKIENKGYSFKYNHLEPALKDLL